MKELERNKSSKKERYKNYSFFIIRRERSDEIMGSA